MSLFEFDQEEYDRNRFEEGKAVGVLEGKEEGRAEGKAEGERSKALQGFARCAEFKKKKYS